MSYPQPPDRDQTGPIRPAPAPAGLPMRESATPPQPPTVSPDPRAGRRGRWIAVTIAAAAVCAVVVATILASTSDHRIAGHPVAASASTTTTGSSETSTPSGDAGAEQSGPVVTGSAGSELAAPTGVEVPQLSDFGVGDCAEPRIVEGGAVAMYRADCAAAPLVLDQVASGECPLENFAGVGHTGQTTYCFSWLLDAGDCLDLEMWAVVPCGTTASGLPTATVVDVRVGEIDGTSCQHPEQYLQAGEGDARGVACYETTGSGDTGSSDDDLGDIPVPTTSIRR